MSSVSSPVWETRNLRDVVTKLVDGSHNPPPKQDIGLPMLSARNIDRGQVLFDDYRLISESAFVSENARTRIAAGDVLLTIVGTIGRTAVVPEGSQPFSLQRSVAVLTPAANLLPKFLCYQLQSPAIQKHFEANARGTAQKGVYLKTLGQTPIVLPPVDVQTEVVAEIEKQFSRLDEAVANLKRVKANLKRYKASVLKDAVEGRLVPTEAELARREGRSFEAGEQLLQRTLKARRSSWNGKGKFKESAAPVVDDLSLLPEAWIWARLDSVAALKGGITVDSKRVDPTARMVPYLRVANVQRGYLDMSEIKQINASEADIGELRLEFGDILFNEGGDRDKLGRGWIWENQVPDCIHQNHVFRARVFLPEISPKLISWWGNSFGKEYFQRVGKQTTNLASINLGKLSEFPIPLPPAAEQRRLVAEIDRRLSLIHGVESEVDANLKRAHALRQSVLQRAFSGEITFRDSSESNIAQVEPLIAAHSFPTEPVSVVMAARIIAANCNEATFGRVKLQKMLYLATHHGQVHAANDEYARKQAGPLDMQMLGGVIKRLDDLRWFREAERAGKSPRDKAYSYSALTKADDHKRHLHVLTPAQQKVIDDLSQLMGTWSTEDCELFATVYAAWNDLILLKHEPTVEAITYEVRENWHESKKRFSTTQVSGMIDKIKRLGYEPTGFGRPTSGKAVDTQTGELF